MYNDNIIVLRMYFKRIFVTGENYFLMLSDINGFRSLDFSNADIS